MPRSATHSTTLAEPGLHRWQDDPLEAVRAACSRVAARARSVRIDEDRLHAYAKELPLDAVAASAPTAFGELDRETRVAFVLTLDAVNFGSGWFPHLRKRPGLSGYRSIEACLLERFQHAGPFTAEELRATEPADCAELLGQRHGDPVVGELMGLFSRAWCDLGAWLQHFDDDFRAPVRAAQGSASALVRSLLDMPLYRDVSSYDGLDVPFLKRAQLTAADLALALANHTPPFRDLDRLTLFADNLVPHVLRIDGVLHCDPRLVARIEAGELLAHGSPEEVELRACAVHAVELLAHRSGRLPPWRLDMWLWQRGAGPTYKARPRHRTRCPYY